MPMGRSMRKETGNVMYRAPLSALSHAPNLDVPLQRGHYVDLSSPAAQRPYFAAWSQENDVQPVLMHLSHAATVKEVLVAWRGELDASLFQVIDATTGELLHMLDTQARLLSSSHAGGQTAHKHRFSGFARTPPFISPPLPPSPISSPRTRSIGANTHHSSWVPSIFLRPFPVPSIGADSIPMRMAMCLEVFRAVCGFDS